MKPHEPVSLASVAGPAVAAVAVTVSVVTLALKSLSASIAVCTALATVLAPSLVARATSTPVLPVIAGSVPAELTLNQT